MHYNRTLLFARCSFGVWQLSNTDIWPPSTLMAALARAYVGAFGGSPADVNGVSGTGSTAALTG